MILLKRWWIVTADFSVLKSHRDLHQVTPAGKHDDGSVERCCRHCRRTMFLSVRMETNEIRLICTPWSRTRKLLGAENEMFWSLVTWNTFSEMSCQLRSPVCSSVSASHVFPVISLPPSCLYNSCWFLYLFRHADTPEKPSLRLICKICSPAASLIKDVQPSSCSSPVSGWRWEMFGSTGLGAADFAARSLGDEEGASPVRPGNKGRHDGARFSYLFYLGA